MNFPSLPPTAFDPSAAALMGDPTLLRALRDDGSHSPHAVLVAASRGAGVGAFPPVSTLTTLNSLSTGLPVPQ